VFAMRSHCYLRQGNAQGLSHLHPSYHICGTDCQVDSRILRISNTTGFQASGQAWVATS
jgi:hypothetical protein